MSSSRPHYFVIGLFVIISTILGVGGIILVSSDALRSPDRFVETYVDESVQGIDVGTPFKFRGVKVGNVSKIALVSTEYDTQKMYVMIRVALEEDKVSPDEKEFAREIRKHIRNGLRLKLVPQGITGLSFLEADFFPDSAAEPLEIDWEPKTIYIPSTPATMTMVTRSLARLAAQVDELDLLEINNNIVAATSNLNLTIQHIEEITGEAQRSSAQVIADVTLAASDMPAITSNLTVSTRQVQTLLYDSNEDVQQVLLNLRYITEDARELLRMLKRHPGMLLTEPPDKNLSRGGK
jgi:phospholipid/cholesterol/gamma-HCH transport system substrate-binding protein/paraquat-inducible protein B